MSESPHPFNKAPHRTVIGLSIPVLFSLIAEPLTGMVDTAFVARLGEVPLAALGVGTSALSSVFWIFNFLGISAQTGVAQADGRNDPKQATQTVSLALALALLFSISMFAIAWPSTEWIAGAIGAEGAIADTASRYLRIRLFGAPAVLITMVAFGALRGRQDMRAPLFIAVSVNVLNIILDYPLIFGVGPFEGLGVGGAALASTIAQYAGAVASLYMVARRFGFDRSIDWRGARDMIVIGGDLFIRTGLLTVVIILSTRIATQAGAEAGAAHQAIRTFSLFGALLLDAFAVTAQSLIGYFIGAKQIATAKRVVRICMFWGVGTGVAMAGVMIFGRTAIETLLVPENARPIFRTAWTITALTQIVGSVSFVTDGVHWGTGDFRYLRNSMLVASGVTIAIMLTLDPSRATILRDLWIAYGIWTTIRAVIGHIRIWPGVGKSPFKPAT